jgi:hypothetical protein
MQALPCPLKYHGFWSMPPSNQAKQTKQNKTRSAAGAQKCRQHHHHPQAAGQPGNLDFASDDRQQHDLAQQRWAPAPTAGTMLHPSGSALRQASTAA